VNALEILPVLTLVEIIDAGGRIVGGKRSAKDATPERSLECFGASVLPETLPSLVIGDTPSSVIMKCRNS